jgi:hypothetical protein
MSEPARHFGVRGDSGAWDQTHRRPEAAAVARVRGVTVLGTAGALPCAGFNAMIRRHSTRAGAPAVRLAGALLTLAGFLAVPSEAAASLFPPEVEDKLATVIALFVIFVVPVVLIALFWMVHVLPEKIAHKRNHPQFEGIRTLCLLSLLFGGLLWPLAWLWAYSRPVFYKMAYGTDTAPHDPEPAYGPPDELPHTLHDRLARVEARMPPTELETLKADLAALEAKLAAREVA